MQFSNIYYCKSVLRKFQINHDVPCKFSVQLPILSEVFRALEGRSFPILLQT